MFLSVSDNSNRGSLNSLRPTFLILTFPWSLSIQFNDYHILNSFIQRKKIEVKETLLQDLTEKKKAIETEKATLELTGGK